MEWDCLRHMRERGGCRRRHLKWNEKYFDACLAIAGVLGEDMAVQRQEEAVAKDLTFLILNPNRVSLATGWGAGPLEGAYVLLKEHQLRQVPSSTHLAGMSAYLLCTDLPSPYM